jgi:hypothetical protein
MSAPATNPTSSFGSIATATPDNAPKTQGVPKPEAPACPGYYFEFPAGQSPYMLYAFQIHAIQVLPWSLKTDDVNRLTLHSNQCSGVAKTSPKGKEVAPLPCTSCANLQNHAIILGIKHSMVIPQCGSNAFITSVEDPYHQSAQTAGTQCRL